MSTNERNTRCPKCRSVVGYRSVACMRQSIKCAELWHAKLGVLSIFDPPVNARIDQEQYRLRSGDGPALTRVSRICSPIQPSWKKNYPSEYGRYSTFHFNGEEGGNGTDIEDSDHHRRYRGDGSHSSRSEGDPVETHYYVRGEKFETLRQAMRAASSA